MRALSVHLANHEAHNLLKRFQQVCAMKVPSVCPWRQGWIHARRGPLQYAQAQNFV